jgi:hypothetical protein
MYRNDGYAGDLFTNCWRSLFAKSTAMRCGSLIFGITERESNKVPYVSNIKYIKDLAYSIEICDDAHCPLLVK